MYLSIFKYNFLTLKKVLIKSPKNLLNHCNVVLTGFREKIKQSKNIKPPITVHKLHHCVGAYVGLRFGAKDKSI